MKIIKRPELKTATVLTPLQLNKIHFSGKHTKLTPEVLGNNMTKATPVAPKD